MKKLTLKQTFIFIGIILLLSVVVRGISNTSPTKEETACDINCQIDSKHKEQADYMKEKMKLKNEAFILSGEIAEETKAYNDFLLAIEEYTIKNDEIYSEILELVNGQSTSQQLQPLGLELEQQLPKLSGLEVGLE